MRSLATLSAIIFLMGSLIAANAQLLVKTSDSGGKPVPDVLLSIYYDAPGAQEGLTEATTNAQGQWRGAINYDKPPGAASYIQIVAYTPYWSSERMQVRLPGSESELAEISFAVPAELSTYRIKLTGEGGAPIGGGKVYFERPYFLQKKTDGNGIAQFRFPAGSSPEGAIFYGGQLQKLDLPDGDPSSIVDVGIKYPFDGGEPSAEPQSYSLSAAMLDGEGHTMGLRSFGISPPVPPVIFASDSAGFLRVRDVPFQKINVSWDSSGYRYSQAVDLASPPAEIRQPNMLKINPPTVASLGEGCYKVQVLVTDPRPETSPQVYARQANSGSKVLFNLDQSVLLDANTVSFSRIICVTEDTSFDVFCSNKYENATVKVQLRKFVAPPPAVGAISTIPKPAAQPLVAEDRKLEVVVLLLVLLSSLVLVYVVLHFRDQASYVWQSITRFLHLSFKNARVKQQRAEFKNITFDARGASGRNSEAPPPEAAKPAPPPKGSEELPPEYSH